MPLTKTITDMRSRRTLSKQCEKKKSPNGLRGHFQPNQWFHDQLKKFGASLSLAAAPEAPIFHEIRGVFLS